MSLNATQLTIMCGLQSEANDWMKPAHAKEQGLNWYDLGTPFLRGAMVECVEAMDPQFKWWKSGEEDIANIKVEIVDAFHFMLSHEIVEAGGSVSIAAENILSDNDDFMIFDGKRYDFESLDNLTKFDLMAALSAVRKTSWGLFYNLCASYGFDMIEFYKLYVGKNVLNIFRQKNGYQTGEYVKIWDGKEDNVFMASHLEQFDINDPEIAMKLDSALQETYDRLAK